MSGKTKIALQVGVKVLFKNREGKCLLLRRSLKKYPEIQGRWDIVGGRIDPGKSLMENLVREVKEETNLDLTEEPKLVAAQDILRNAGRHVVRLTYVGRIEGEVRLDEDENDMYAWYSPKVLNQLDDIDMYFKDLLGKGVFNFFFEA